MRFERLMGCTAHDLQRWLPEALGSYYPRCTLEIDGITIIQVEDPLIQMVGLTKSDRQIALLRIPQLLLQLKFINLTDHQIQALLERFDLYTRRGGG
jgi:hypothetical protein